MRELAGGVGGIEDRFVERYVIADSGADAVPLLREEPSPQTVTTLIASPVSDTVYSADGSRLYAALTGGGVAVYDTASGALLNTIAVGSFLAGIDISPDGSFLLVVEDNGAPGNITGTVHKVDIATGTVTDFSKAFFSIEGPFHDIAILDNGLAIATTRIRGSGNTNTYSLNTATGVFSFLTFGSPQAPIVMPSADRRHVALAQGFNVSGPNQLYSLAGNGSIQLDRSLGPASSGQSVAAYSADGALFAAYDNAGLRVFDNQFNFLASVTPGYVAFDATGDFMYVLDSTNIRKYSTTTWAVVDTISTTGVSVSSGIGYGSGEILTVGPDSAYLLYNNGSTVFRIDNPTAVTPVEGLPIGETMNGTALADVLHGNDGNDTLNGAAGDDILRGGAGNDVLDGGTGHDAMYGGTGDDTYYVDDARDLAVENDNLSGTDAVFSSVSYALGPNIENLTLTGTGNLDATGNSLANVLLGTSGNNVLNGMGGADTMTGFGGDDTYWVDNIGDQITEAAGGGIDTVRTTLTVFTLGAEFENLAYGGSGAFTGTGNGLANVLTGGTGADTLFGGAGNDTLIGGGGSNSRLYGEEGNDRFVVGFSDFLSWIDGGADFDTLAVSEIFYTGTVFAGIEAVEFSPGSNLVITAANFKTGMNNAVLSGSGSLEVYMAPTDLELVFGGLTIAGGSTIAVTVHGSTGDDLIKGLIGAVNSIDGGDGNDQIRGGSLGDIINGGNGDDKIFGANGADIMTGGAGADTFRFQTVSSSGMGAAADQITDFVIGTDKLSFVLIDADPVTPGDQAFAFLGTSAFTAGGTGQIRYMNTGANLLVQVDVDGNGTVDMEVVLQGLTGQTLTGASFLL